MRIAIDGPAASGKTSVGRALAKAYGCRFVETGKMYRAVALGFIEGLALDEMEIEVTASERFILNGRDVTDELHTEQLDRGSSEVGTIPEVRTRLVEIQQEIASQGNVVMEGRDIGTVVIPDADVKLFLDASARKRAERRAMQRDDEDVAAIVEQLVSRDQRDQERPIAPLKAAPDAIIIETDQKPLKEVISEASELVEERLGKRCDDG